MKQVLIAATIALTSLSSMAHGPNGPYVRYEHRYYHHDDIGWIAPAVIGGLVVYAATRPPVVIPQPPVVIQQQTCGPWIEIRNADGTVSQSRTCQ